MVHHVVFVLLGLLFVFSIGIGNTWAIKMSKDNAVKVTSYQRSKTALKAFYESKSLEGQRFKDITPNVTKGCIIHEKPYPQVYEKEIAPGFNLEDKAAIAASTLAIVNKFEDLYFGVNNTLLAKITYNTTDYGIWTTVEEKPRLIVGFATTTPIISDFRAWPTICKLSYRERETFDCGTAHTGFFEKYKGQSDDVIDNLVVLTEKNNINEIIYTGGSQGAAVAEIAALHSKFLFPAWKVKLVNFAAPELFGELPTNPLPTLDRATRYAASYIASENDKYHPGYFCVDDVVALPTAITNTFYLKFQHIYKPTYIPCQRVTPDGQEGQVPNPRFTLKDLFQINWMCHEASFYNTRFVYWEQLQQQ